MIAVGDGPAGPKLEARLHPVTRTLTSATAAGLLSKLSKFVPVLAPSYDVAIGLRLCNGCKAVNFTWLTPAALEAIMDLVPNKITSPYSATKA